jgi:hypothetical protein
VSALVPIFVNGLNNPSLVRGVAEAECWFEGLVGPDGALMRRTRAVLLQEMERQGRGLVLAPEERMVCMPDRLHEFNRVPIALMGWRTMAEQLAPFPQDSEERMLWTMVEELDVNFGVKVSRNLDLRRTDGGSGAADYVVIGGSNGGQLCTVLKKKGRQVIDLTEKGCRIKGDTVEKLEKEIVDRVTEDMVVVLMATDSSLYFCEDEEGARCLPEKGSDGKYHIVGQLRLASAKQAAKVLQKLLPLLRLLKKNKKIILVPLPRYICLACCDDKTHCVNRKEDGFIDGLLEGLREIRREMKDACHEWKVANYKVVNGCTLLGLTEDSDYASWEAAMGTDPVHLTEGALGRMAGQLFEMAEGSGSMFSGGKRALEDDEDRPSPLIQGRKPWIYGPSQGRGGRGGRGGQGGQRGGRGGARGGYTPGGFGARSLSSSGAGYSGYTNNSNYGNKKR